MYNFDPLQNKMLQQSYRTTKNCYLGVAYAAMIRWMRFSVLVTYESHGGGCFLGVGAGGGEVGVKSSKPSEHSTLPIT
jgi:hypothetical protein